MSQTCPATWVPLGAVKTWRGLAPLDQGAHYLGGDMGIVRTLLSKIRKPRPSSPPPSGPARPGV